MKTTINNKQYTVYNDSLSGALIKQIPNVTIPQDHDLFMMGIGEQDDIKIDDHQIIRIVDNFFYSAPKKINQND